MIQMRHEYLESIDSTNNEIKRRAVAGETEGLVISAGKQTAGRGRSGHQWETPADISIATSLLLRPTVVIDHLSSLTLVAAVAVRRAIEELYGIETWIKWPNDVIIHGKKVCGILTEMSASEGKAEYVVVGIGSMCIRLLFPRSWRTRQSLWIWRLKSRILLGQSGATVKN